MGVMKNTGVAWIGEIPSEWELGKVKYGFVRKKEKSTESNPVVLSLARTGVRVRDISTNEGQLAASYEGYNPVEPNDLLLNPMDLISGANCSISHVSGVISPAYMNLCARNGFEPRYYDYFFKTQYWSLALFAHGKGVSFDNRWTLNESTLRDYYIPMPPYEEQQAIAAYLDDRCSKLDEIITEVEKSIEEYKELKQAVIFEAVTKGLDKNATMKDSGMEFVDRIPENWHVVRFIRTNWVRGRLGWKGLKADEYVDDGYPFLSAFNIINNRLSWEEVNHITQERYDESPEIKLSVGDIVLVKDGAGIGKCARLDELPFGEATVNSSLAVISPHKEIFYKYEYYYFLSPLFQNIITRLRNGMGVPHLTQESMKAIYIPIPSVEEQKEISAYLDARVDELDALIFEKQALIEDLKAYKKSLIYEFVTGKRRVV